MNLPYTYYLFARTLNVTPLAVTVAIVEVNDEEDYIISSFTRSA